MSNENNSDENSVEVMSEDETIQDNETINEINESNSLEELKNLLEVEKRKSRDLDSKLKHAIADFQNLNKKTQSEIEHGINLKLSLFMIEFLKIYDDFVRAKEVYSNNDENIEGLDSILKNMNSLLEKNEVIPIDALGEIFDPNFHEAISIINDPKLDDNTITKEIRKGYISHNKVIRPTLVEISKKQGKN
ncbi:MAG: nucleotide exchange factor GrpE [Nitrosopumilus sp.]|jgi:molecular chaperone GrpE|nr:nucleotide exchange factor GrpE [Nitrosopumilus sp.]